VQENGTCATLYQVPSICESNLALNPLQDHIRITSPLSINDLTLTPLEFQQLNDSMLNAVLCIIVLHAGPQFSKYQELLERDVPTSGFQLPNKPAIICPLPATQELMAE
jgi:hypothetical protein